MKRFATSILTAVVLAAGCIPGEKPAEENKDLIVKATIVGYDTGYKAADKGVCAGISVEFPYSADNVRAVADANGRLVPDPAIARRTSEGKTRYTVSAYIPYDAKYGRSGGKFKVAADQSGDEAFGASTIYMCSKVFTVAEMKHDMPMSMFPATSCMRMRFDNRTTLQISSVSVSGICGAMDIDIAGGTATADGSNGTFIAHRAGNDLYELITASQKVSPVIRVTMSDGQKYTFGDFKGIVLVPGSVWENDVAMTLTPRKPVDPSEFTSLDDMGVYEFGGSGIVPVCIYRKAVDQYAYGTSGSGRTWRIQNFEEGWIISLSCHATDMEEGVETTVDAFCVGKDSFASGSHIVEVARADDGKVWLKGDRYGFIIAAE